MRAKTKIKYILPIILALALLASVTQVHATTTYNWIRNAGFDAAGGNCIANDGFESGSLSPYWTNDTGVSIESNPHNGTYSVLILYPSHYIMQNLTVPLDLSSMLLFRFWWLNTAQEGAYQVRVTVCWTNSTSTSILKSVECWNGTAFNWDEVDCTDDLGNVGIINAIKIDAYAKTGYVDDVELISVATGEQSRISYDTLPWFTMDVMESDLFSNISTFGHSYPCSYYTYSYPFGAFPLLQLIDYLDSNTVSEVSLWAYSAIPDCRIEFRIYYCDGTHTIQTITMDSTSTWEKLTFTSLILPNRIINGIGIQVLDGNSAEYTNLDDVSLLSTTEQGVSVFTWTLNPDPISYPSNTSFTAWQRTAYLFTGFIHNATGYINGTGTYTLTSSQGTQTGAIVNGVFSLTLSARLGLPDIPLVETLRFHIVTDMANFTVSVNAVWSYIYEDAGGGAGETTGIPIEITQFLNMLYVFIVVFAPPLITSILVRKVKGDAMVGFIAGLALSVVAGIITGIVPIWGLFIITLVLAYSIFAKVREK